MEFGSDRTRKPSVLRHNRGPRRATEELVSAVTVDTTTVVSSYPRFDQQSLLERGYPLPSISHCTCDSKPCGVSHFSDPCAEAQ